MRLDMFEMMSSFLAITFAIGMPTGAVIAGFEYYPKQTADSLMFLMTGAFVVGAVGAMLIQDGALWVIRKFDSGDNNVD